MGGKQDNTGKIPNEYLSELPDEIPNKTAVALFEADYPLMTPSNTYNRVKYASVLARNDAYCLKEALRADEIKEEMGEYLGKSPSSSAVSKALTDLCEDEIVERDTSRKPYLYWISPSLKPTAEETSDVTQVSEPDSSNDLVGRSSTPNENEYAESWSYYLDSPYTWLSALVIGLGLALLTIILFRFSVPPAIPHGTAQMSWDSLWLVLLGIGHKYYHHQNSQKYPNT